MTRLLSLGIGAHRLTAVLALKRFEGGQMPVIVYYGAEKEQASLGRSEDHHALKRVVRQPQGLAAPHQQQLDRIARHFAIIADEEVVGGRRRKRRLTSRSNVAHSR